MSTSVIGYPRIGSLRELKFALEAYFKGEKTEDYYSRRGFVTSDQMILMTNNSF